MSPNKKAARIKQAANDQMGKVRKGEKPHSPVSVVSRGNKNESDALQNALGQNGKCVDEAGTLTALCKKSIQTIHEKFSPFDGLIIPISCQGDITESWTDHERFVNIGLGVSLDKGRKNA